MGIARQANSMQTTRTPAGSSENGLSDVISQIPFAPFSLFLNDLSRPLLLNNIQPAPEAILSGNSKLLQCINKENISVAAVRDILQATPFDQSNFLLNQPPVKEIAHEFDEFMIAVLEECFEKESPVFQPSLHQSHQQQQEQVKATPMTVPEPTSHARVKLFVGGAGGSGDAMNAFNRLVEAESFVSPLCFDCREDLSVMGRVLRAFTSAPPRLADIPSLNAALIGDSFAQFIRDYLECLQDNRIESDPAKALYCMCLIAFCNVYRHLTAAEAASGQNIPYVPFDEFMTVLRVAQVSNEEGGEDRSEFELICSAAIDSYTRLPAHEIEASARVNHLLELFFGFESSIQLRRACISGLSTAFPLFDLFILEQALNRCIQAGTASVNKATSALLLSVLQASPALSTHLNFILNYLWKGDGAELPKGTALFASLFEETLNCCLNAKWPAAPFICNHICLQMFHALLRGEDNTKGAILLKLRFLDQLTTAATFLGASNKESATSRGLMAAIESSPLPASASSSPSVALEKIPERVAGLLIKLISGETAQFRSKAIKNLYMLMNSPVLDSSNGSALKQNVLNRLSDPSISVRDAVLEFVSKLLLDSKGQVSDDVLCSVQSRIKDRGLSVRKRACKILGELLAKGDQSLGSSQRISSLAVLLSHWPEEEDESLQDSQFKALRDQWLMPCKNSGNFRAFAEELSALLKSPISIISPLQDFISRVVSTSTDDSIAAGLNGFLAETVNALLESLLRGLESNQPSNEVVKSALDTITVLACQPDYLLSHLALLHTLLRSEDVEVSFASLRLFHIVLPAASFAELKKLESGDLERDLLSFIYRGSEVAVKLAIECLYIFVNNCSHQYGTLSSLWTRFSEYLKLKQSELEADCHDLNEPTGTTNNTSSNTPANMARALIALGVLGAQSAVHSERELGVKDVHSTPQVRSLLQIIQFYCTVPWPFVRTCALSALCSLLLACPQLAACWSPFADLMASFLTGHLSDDASRSKILGLLSSILSGSSSAANERSILKLEGKESFHAALIQSLVPQLCSLSCASSCRNEPSFAIKAQALKLASSAAVLGFVNPHHVLPFVCVGMAADDDHLQAFSQASFDRLLGRFPSLAPRDLLQIGKLIWNTHPQARGFINSPCPLSGSIQSQSLLSTLYTCLRSSAKKSLKVDLLSGLFGFFERLMSPESASLTSQDHPTDPKFISFLVELIVTLPLQSHDEVSLLLMKIQSLFPLAEDVIESGDSSLINCVFVALHGFSAALSYLLRSFPGINAASLQEESASSTSRSMSRVPLVFNWKQPEIPVTPEALNQLLASQISITELILKVTAASQRTKRRSSMEDDDEDEDHEAAVEMELDEDDDDDGDESGGASSEEFEAMLMDFQNHKKGVTEKHSSKKSNNKNTAAKLNSKKGKSTNSKINSKSKSKQKQKQLKKK